LEAREMTATELEQCNVILWKILRRKNAKIKELGILAEGFRLERNIMQDQLIECLKGGKDV
jgi:hypothetical protein